MENRLKCLGGLLVACLGITQLAGCCCNDALKWCAPDSYGYSQCQVYEGIGPACFGYHSTCWRPWPEECQTCPPPSWSDASTSTGKVPVLENESVAPMESTPPIRLPQPMPDEGIPPPKPSTSPSPEVPEKAPGNPGANSSSSQGSYVPPRSLKSAPSKSEEHQVYQAIDLQRNPASSGNQKTKVQKYMPPPVVVDTFPANNR